MSRTLTGLQDQILVASPHLHDPYFERSVVYICDHSDIGATGFVVNIPTELMLSDVFSDMSIKVSNSRCHDQAVFSGGPVKTQQGFVLHRSTEKKWTSSLHMGGELAVTSSRDILDAMASDAVNTDEHLLILGYASWSSGQLEDELVHNDWLIAPRDMKLIFDTPIEARWDAAMHSLGVNPMHLSDAVGYA